MNLTEDIVQIRVALGLVYVQLLIEKMTIDQALSILSKFAHRKEFTLYEINEMRYLIAEWEYLLNRRKKRSQKKLDERIRIFFDNYSGFHLYHYKSWNEINAKIIKDFSLKN